MKIFVSYIFLQIVHCAIGFSMNPWASNNLPSMFNHPLFKNPELPPPYKNCSKETYGVMNSVQVVPCTSSKRCPLIKGSNVTLNLEFIPSFAATNVIGSLAGVLNSYLPSVPFGKPQNLCETKQVDCPLTPGKLYRYTTTIFVLPSYPSFKLDAKVQVHGDKSEIACAIIPIELVKPSLPPRSMFSS